jgi:hypothetical protein
MSGLSEQGEIGSDLFRAACEMGLERLVSKRRDRPYQGGRSKHWIKVKNRAPGDQPGYGVRWYRHQSLAVLILTGERFTLAGDFHDGAGGRRRCARHTGATRTVRSDTAASSTLRGASPDHAPPTRWPADSVSTASPYAGPSVVLI